MVNKYKKFIKKIKEYEELLNQYENLCKKTPSKSFTSGYEQFRNSPSTIEEKNDCFKKRRPS